MTTFPTTGHEERTYKGGGFNTDDPMRIRAPQGYHSPSVQWRSNLGFRCYRTVCSPKLDEQ